MQEEAREELMVRAPALSDAIPGGDDLWDWYFPMQHFGAPTRLLDRTEGAVIALYFAVKDNPGTLNEPRQGEKPNVYCDPKTYQFFALRDIRAGEELTVNYSTYSEQPDPGSRKRRSHVGNGADAESREKAESRGTACRA